MNGDWIDRLERRFGSWSLPDLPLFIVAMNAAIYVLAHLKPAFPQLLSLDPGRILAGEVWRLVTYLFIPPLIGPLLLFFWLYLLFVYAQALEAEWGEFRFNLYYALGAAATAAAALAGGAAFPNANVPVNASLFLAFAALYPDFELLLFFVLPVKVKWLALLAWLGLAWSFLGGGWLTRLALAAGLANYAVFFGPRHWQDFRFWLQVRRNRRRFRGPGGK